MTQRPSLLRPWGTKSEYEDPVGMYLTGWEPKTKPPHQTQNYLQVTEDAFTLTNMEDGVPYWRNNITYVDNALVKYEDNIYVSLKSNLNVVPVVGATWGLSLLNYGGVELADLIRGIDNTNSTHAARRDNPHQVTSAQIGSHSKAQFDALLKAVSSGLTSHEAKVDNPHKVTVSQLGILPKGGGVMKWMDFTQSDLLLRGVVTLRNSTNFTYIRSRDSYALGILGSKAQVVLGTSQWQHLIHTGNIVAERTLIEPLYTLPPPDMQAKLTSTLGTKYCRGGAQTTGTPTFSPDGVVCTEQINFELPTDYVGTEQTVAGEVSGTGSFAIGRITFTGKVDGTITISDGTLTVYSGANDGKFTFVKTTSRGIVYKDGIEVASKPNDMTAHIPQAFIVKGGGGVKNIQVWASALSPEQVTKI